MAEVEPEIETPLLPNTADGRQIEEIAEKEQLQADKIGVESLDYDPIQSLVFSRQKKVQQRRRLYGLLISGPILIHIFARDAGLCYAHSPLSVVTALAAPVSLSGDLSVEAETFLTGYPQCSAESQVGYATGTMNGYTGLTLAKWSITITIGLLVGTVAYIVESSQELLVTYKKVWTQTAIDLNYSLWVGFGGYLAFGVFLVLVSSLLVLFWAPAAAGGGVTLVMAYLNGNDVPDFFRVSTLFTKIIGTICTISSGLPIGQEGPMIHIGAAIASCLTWMQGHFPSRQKDGRIETKGFFSKMQPKAFVFDFHNDKDRREFISAGTAAGLAAAFGAPIGGVLFSLEEASSFWSKKVMWRSLLCSSVATLVLSWLHERAFSFSLPGNIAFHGLQPEFVIGDLPLFIITSAAAGVLGAFVNITHGWLSQIRPHRKCARLLEACLVTAVAVGVIFILPHVFGHCILLQEGEEDTEYWFQYTCSQQESEDGEIYYNDLATLFFSVPHQTIQRLLQLGPNTNPYFSLTSLAIHCGSFLVLFILAYGIATPGGIFMPSMMVGASFGALLGCIFGKSFPARDVQPGLHALIGSAAMLGGVFRSSISVVVIVTEATGGIDFVLPVILAIVISNWVAHHIHHAGAYEADLARLGDICFLQSEPPHTLIPVSAMEIMARNVICFPEVPTVHEVVNALRNTAHNGFPVLRYLIQDGPYPEDGVLVGLILRHQLLLLLEQRVFVEVEGNASYHQLPYRSSPGDASITKQHQLLEHAMRVYHHCHNPHRRYLTSRPAEVDRLGLDELLQGSAALIEGCATQQNAEAQKDAASKKEFALDLRPFMNRSPLTVRGECSAQRVFVIFRTLGLRHLCVTDACNRVIGMITRKDIAKAQHSFTAEGLKRLQPSLSDLEGRSSNKDMYYYLP